MTTRYNLVLWQPQAETLGFLLENDLCLESQGQKEKEDATGEDAKGLDAMLLRAHARCHGLRALSQQLCHASTVRAVLDAELLPKLLALATNDLAAAPALVLGRKATNVMHLPIVSALAARLNRVISCSQLQSLADRLWERVAAVPAAAQALSFHARSMMQAKLSLEPLKGDVSIEGFRVRAASHFPTVWLAGVSLSAELRGRWYYEVVLLTDVRYA